MDTNNLRTSVIIEVATQEETEDQKTYHIDFDDLDLPKDYVIDQVFCGENITVYALFEVPEDVSTTSKEQQKLEQSDTKSRENCRFIRNNTLSRRRENGFQRSIKTMNSSESELNRLPNKDNGSFYCLKHLGGDYDMLTTDRENSDLKVLYSKSAVSRNYKSTKFKAVSKGVNTDIVQSPKIIQEVQKAIKQNCPFQKQEDKSSKSRSVSSKPSYEVIEMEMRQSFSSVSSCGGSRKQSKNSIPNFFLVPLLMMDDGVLSHFQGGDSNSEKIEKSEKTGKPEKIQNTEKTQKVQTCVQEVQDNALVQLEPPERVSMGTNTDLLMVSRLKTEIKYKENATEVSEAKISSCESECKEQYEPQKEETPRCSLKMSKKVAILNEIKKLQGKINSLIKSIETDSFELEAEDQDILTEESPTDNGEVSSETSIKSFGENRSTFVEPPASMTLVYPVYDILTVEKNPSDISPETEHEEDVPVALAKSFSIGVLSGVESHSSQIMRSLSTANCDKSVEEVKKSASDCSIIWSNLENRKGLGLSKSTTNTHQSLVDPKLNLINGLKKSLSFDLKDVKVEVMCLKKIKNYSFKFEKKADIRIPQKGETIIKREMGDEAFNNPKTSGIDLLSLSIAMEKVDDLEIEKLNLDTKKNLKVEEGDAKFETVYSKEKLLSQMISRQSEDVEVHFCNTINSISQTPVNDKVTNEKGSLSNSGKPKAASVPTDPEPKVSTDLEKPTTPNKYSRKVTPPSTNLKKEVKPVKRANIPTSKVKVADKILKPEGKDAYPSQDNSRSRSVTGSRKFTLKASAVSKLHVDKLIKSESSKSENSNNSKYENLNNSKSENSNNSKSENSNSSKSENQNSSKCESPKVTGTEKPGHKTSRSLCQKREPAESLIHVVYEESREYKEEINSNSSNLLNKKEVNETESVEKIVEGAAESTEVTFHEVVPHESGVVVELFSEKPKSVETLRTLENQTSKSLLKALHEDNTSERNDKDQDASEDTLSTEKPVVKSVWALTKVLLFEDGSKKIEVLEASLTPPGYSLPKIQPHDSNTLN